MPGNKGNLLRLESSHSVFLKIKLAILCAVPIAVWFFTEDEGLTCTAAILMAVLAGAAFFSRRDVYKFYDDCLIINEARTEKKTFEVSLLRIGNIAAKHLFFQPANVGNIFLVLQSIKRPSITARMLGAKDNVIPDRYPFDIIIMRNIKDYQRKVQLIEKIVKKAKEESETDGAPVLQGVTNVDEMLPWLGRKANEK